MSKYMSNAEDIISLKIVQADIYKLYERSPLICADLNLAIDKAIEQLELISNLPENPTVSDVLLAYGKAHGYDGLYYMSERVCCDDDICPGCELNNLNTCACGCRECQFGYIQGQAGGLGPDKPHDSEKEVDE